MNEQIAKSILDKIIGQVFGYQNPLSLEQAMQKFAFDVRLPQMVYDSTDNKPTWAQSTNPTKFIRLENAKARIGVDDWMLPKKPLQSLEDILSAWGETNLMTTERQIDSINFAESDNVYRSENVYRSQDVVESKNILFSDGSTKCEFMLASQRSNNSSFCIRAEDSTNSSNCFGVIWSNKAVNCIFVQDCFDVYECMFCSHIGSKKYCIANMQFEEAEYFALKDQVIRWILSN